MNAGANTVRIIDATLREGCQAPGVRLGHAQSIEIASLLAEAGVDMIECGHPLVSLHEKERVQKIVRLGLDVPILSHARAQRADVEAVAAAGASWAGIFLGVNDITRKARLPNHTVDTLLKYISDAVKRARALGLKVRYTLEDACRTEEALMIRAYRAALEAGADRLCFADTVGILAPEDVRRYVSMLKGEFPNTDLEIHLHDDRGLAMANTLAAIDAGANWISTSVNGQGERAGITDLCLLLANLHYRGDRTLPPGGVIRRLSTIVATHSRIPIDAHRPVTGSNAFNHTAHLHVKAMLRDPMAYNWIPPELVGTTNRMNTASLPEAIAGLFTIPDVIAATELIGHSEGPGTRHVMIDERYVPDCRQYCIVREIFPVDGRIDPHVDPHRHTVDSLFLFIGGDPGLRGLRVEVELDGLKQDLASPASVFIPAGVTHTYRVIGGRGIFVNFVLTGSYNDSVIQANGRPCLGPKPYVNGDSRSHSHVGIGM